MATDRLRGQLDPMLLAVLAKAPAHGYAVITALRERSGGLFDLPEGTVYPALHRLERAGLLTSSWEPGTTRRRRVYAVTAGGRRSLATERRQWRAFAGGVNLVMAGAS
jgi:PadR family transcriptional regulator, regulatory protein PadR